MRTLLIFAFLCLGGVFSVVAETIEVDGTSYFEAELVEVCNKGVIYRVEGDDQYVTVPWAKLSAIQRSSVKRKFSDGIDNAKYDVYFVKGTVFEISPTGDGVIVQVDLAEDESGPGFQNGVRVLNGGLVIIKDLPASISREEGAVVEIKGHKRGTYTYDMRIASKEIPCLTVARPAWAMEQEWKNISGKAIYAKLIAVKDGKGMFEKAGKRFIYDLADLDAEARKRAQDIAEKLKGYPVP